ncbi:MAG: glycosyltransferase family 4 protein [Candidatus Sumerlaeota bacterium]|nr:glycosyltransferase family 4 protein [Candidatus Sumerlaeota bacterium]
MPDTFSILHLVSSERWTGAADPVISLAKLQHLSGHKTFLACIGGYTFEQQARQSGIEILTSLTMDRRLYPINLYKDCKKLLRLVEKNQINVIHTHLLHDHWMAALALRSYKNPHLLLRTMHRFEWPRRDPLHQWLFRKQTDHLIATSEAMRQRILARLGVAPDHVSVSYGGVDLDRFHPGVDPAPLCARFHIPPGALVAGIVARMRAGRGHDWLMRTAPAVIGRIPKAHFLIIGRGELKHSVREQISQRPERGHLHSTGYLAEDLPLGYAAMTCSMFLGQGSEGTCRAILEAMACGKPVIGVDDGGVKEIIAHGRTGFVVKKDDDAGLRDALLELLGNPGRAAEMGRQAREECASRFTEEMRTQNILSAYQRVWNAKYK